MHRFAVVVLSASLVLGAAACSDDDSGDESSDPSNASEATDLPTDNTFDAGDDQPFCDQYEALGDAMIDATAGEGDVEAALVTVQEAYAGALELAPDEIADSMVLVNENVQSSEDLASIVLVSGDVLTASEDVNDWAGENCGIDLRDYAG